MSAPLSTDQNVVQALEARILLLAPSMGWWRGQFKLKDAQVTLGNDTVDETRTTKPQVKLLEASDWTRSWRERFQDLDTERRTFVVALSESFPIHGVRMVPRAKADLFFATLVGPTDDAGRPLYNPDAAQQSIAYRLNDLAEQFCSNHSMLLREIRENISEAEWAAVSGLIPDRSSLREKFYIDIAPVELAGGSLKVGREQIAQYDTFIRQSTERLVTTAIEEMVSGPRDELAQSITRLHELIQRDGRVTDASFNGVRQAIEKIRLFSFIADDALLVRIHELEEHIGQQNPDTLTREVASENGLSTALNEVRRDVTDAERRAADVGRFGRSLRGFSI